MDIPNQTLNTELEPFELKLEKTKGDEGNFTIPLRYRRMENLHILFWLLKDISWCMIWRPLGIAMIFPTLTFAIIITIRTRHFISEFYHNVAVVCWILANSYWMISEFLVFDSEPVNFYNFSYKDLTIIPFSIGILFLAYFYIWLRPRYKNQVETL